MTLEIHTHPLGSFQTNTYLLVNPATRQAVLVDPTFKAETLIPELEKRALTLTALWLTHAHFDHMAGAAALAARFPGLGLGLHPLDRPLYEARGGAEMFGFQVSAGPAPTLAFAHGQVLTIGSERVEVRHTPGHTPGHVVFYLPACQSLLCGDLIFEDSVGRTDLPGSSSSALMTSIRGQVLTLPPETLLLPGHGPATTIDREARHNPFL